MTDAKRHPPPDESPAAAVVRVTQIETYAPGVDPMPPDAKPIAVRWFVGDRMELEVSEAEATTIRIANERAMAGLKGGSA